MKNVLYFILILSLQLSPAAFSQSEEINVLKIALKNAAHDTVRCKILLQLAETASDEEWPKFNDSLKMICESKLRTLANSDPSFKKFKGYYAAALNNKGFLANQNGNIAEAIHYYTESIRIQEEIGDKAGLAASYNNIGFIYKAEGNTPLAIEYYSRSIKIQEEIKLPNGEIADKKGLAYSLINMGVIYLSNGDTARAMEYYMKSLKIREEIKDKAGIAHSLNNIGSIYMDSGDSEKALGYFLRSLELRKLVGDKTGIANSLHNVAFAYQKKEDFPRALENYMNCIRIQEEIGDKNGLSYSLSNVATVYLAQNKIKEALVQSGKSMELAKLVGSPATISQAAKVLSRINKVMGNPEGAYENYKLYIQMNDSVNSEIARKASIRSQLKYEYEKKAAADSVRVAQEKKVAAVELKQKVTQRYALYGGLTLVALFALFMTSRFRKTREQRNIISSQKEIVEQQKQIVEEKQKEVLDSIHYARRIQASLLPKEKYIERTLKKFNSN